MVVMERRMSREVVGVRILRREDSIDVRIVVSTPANGQHLSSVKGRGLRIHTFEVASLDANQLPFDAFT